MFGTSNLSETTCSLLHRYNTGFKFQSQKRVWKITVTWSSPGLVLVYISHINTFEGQIRTKLRKEKGGLKMCVLNLCLCIHSTHHTRINTNTSSTLSNYSYILTGWEGGGEQHPDLTLWSLCSMLMLLSQPIRTADAGLPGIGHFGTKSHSASVNKLASLTPTSAYDQHKQQRPQWQLRRRGNKNKRRLFVCS